MAYSLPLNADGSITAFTSAQITAMGILARGITNNDHVRYNFGPDGSGCTRKFSCAWGEQFNTLLYFVGACNVWNPTAPGAPAATVSRMLPLVDPDYANWVCTKVEFEPFAFTGAVDAPVSGTEPYPEYERADFTATFELVPFALQTDAQVAAAGYTELGRYVTYPGYPGAEVTADSQYIGLPGGALQYSTPDGTRATGPAGVPIPYPVGFVEGSEKFKVIWQRVPFAAWGPSAALTQAVLGTTATRGMIGSVNMTEFAGYPPGSLQLLGVEQRLLPDPNGLGYSWCLAYVMSHKPVPYGQLGFYYHDTKTAGAQNGYYQVQRPGAGTTTKATANLGDTDSLLVVREFANLFSVAG